MEAEFYVCSTGSGDLHDVTTDRDGDGIDDALDLCPDISDPAQDNEDGDRFGDACDPCPPIADDNPPNADGDSVADACDPEPMMPGDAIVRFEGFHRPSPGWTTTGPWVLEHNAATVDVAAGMQATLTFPTPMSSRTSAATSFRVDALNSAFGYSGAGIIDQYESGAGIACHAFRSAGQQRLGLINIASASSLDVTAMKVEAGARYVTTMYRSTQYHCRGVHDDAAAEVAASYTPSADAPAIGLGVQSAGVTFDWVLVVAGP